MSEIDSVIEKAKILELNLKMEMLLKHNLSILKEKVPALYNVFSNYEESELALYYDTDGDGYLNLVNTKNNLPVYPMDPGIFAAKQIELYVKRPLSYKLSFTKSSDDLGQIHAKYADKLVGYYTDEIPEQSKRDSLPESMRFMLMLGCGFGLHIADLLEKTDLKHLCIYEPHMDAFYASLHTTDWSLILEHFDRVGYSIEFCIGMSARDTLLTVSNFLNREGAFNSVITYFYKHFDSPEVTEMLSLFLREFHLSAFGWGYFDDERLSLAHTVENHIKKIPVLNKTYQASDLMGDVPVFLVANGPSLDDCADLLKKNQNNSIIISCGTAIGSLYKMGIKPDIHIEMERTKPVIEWIEVGTDKEFRKGIKLVALNPVHPGVFDLFDDAYMALKPNDAGTAFMHSCLKPESNTVMANASNPTVANCGFSVCMIMGFRNINLVGLDLSLKSAEQRHSKYSVYSDIESETESQIGYQFEDGGNFLVKGNFQEKVLTTPMYDNARSVFEYLLKFNKHPTYNLSDGVFISGAEPRSIKDVSFKVENFDKNTLISSMFDEIFSSEPFVEVTTHDEAKRRISLIKDALFDLKTLLNSPICSKQGVYDILNDLHKYTLSLSKSEKTSMCFYLLKGSVTYMTSLIALVINDLSEAEVENHFLACKEIVDTFLSEAEMLIEQAPFELDETRRDLMSNLKVPLDS